MTGRILLNRYELLDKIGEGGMAEVYRAHCKILDRVVAVKILKKEFSQDNSFVDKFRTEALAAAKLSHPNIVNIYDVGQENDVYFIVMEYIEGCTLKDIIDADAPLEPKKAIDIAIMICDGLHHAHERGIVHKDVKPQNILVTSTGIVKVADFGIAQAVSKKTITFGGNIAGSVQYISPEQAKGEPVTRATDIYSAGCVLYEMLTGQVPFDAESPITVALKHIHDEAVFPSGISNQIPEGLQAIVYRAMEKLPQHRFATAEEMRNTLLSLSSGVNPKTARLRNQDKTLVMPPVSSEGKDSDLTGKKKLKRSGIAILIVAALGLLLGVLYVLGDNLFGNEVDVPDLVGMKVDQAKMELDKYGLKMVVEESFDNDVEIDHVISQSPPPRMSVKEGREVTVVVSKGAQSRSVPNLVGETLQDAEISLKNEGFSRGRVDYEYDDKYAEGFVFSQDPKSGSKAKEGSKVNLLVSKGKSPEKISMPSLIGKGIEEARQILADNKLEVGEIKEADSSQYTKGQVIEQDTDAGVMVDEGTKINLTVSKGPGPVAQTRAIEFRIPEEQDYYKVVIEVKDSHGKRVVYNQNQAAGEIVYVGVSHYGAGKAQVFLNDNFYRSYDL